MKVISPHKGFQERFVRSNIDVVFGGGVLNAGKPNPLDTKILTKDGWSTMGDMYVGAKILTPWNGETTVTAVYPQGVQDCYRIETFDGRVCEAGLEHLWMVRTKKQYLEHKGRHDSYTIALTRTLIEGIANGEEYYIPMPDFNRLLGEISVSQKGILSKLSKELANSKDHVRIKSIEYVGKKQLQCIKVDDKDHLYIIDDFITTHNSFGAILSLAEPSLDPNFRACFTRRTFSELKSGGGVVDDVETCYKDYASVKRTDPPRATFPSGAFVDFRQINDENPAKVKEIWKGSQYDLIYMDELTSYEFSTFKYLMTRNRGKAKWTGKFRGTTNPERDCWVRKFIDWYVGTDGLIIPERDGMIRYFYLGDGEDVEDVTWGDSKLEVYENSKIDIDAKLRILGEGFTYENLIKSFTFYLGHMSENISSIGGNKDYAGSVAAVGGKQAKQLIEGNWNVSLKNDEQMPIPIHLAESVFANDPRINNDKWITADLADTGVDNTVILVWNGLHIHDYLILCTSTPRMNAEKLMLMAEKHNIPDNHIVYDGIRAVYINDYIPEAIPFVSYRKTRGKYGRAYYNLKDECYARLVNVIRRENLSMDDKIASAVYDHLNMSVPITIRNEFIEECSVVKFKDMPGGKKTLLNKKEMNAILGKGRSMDLLDPIAMRMYPLLEYEYGQELVMTECNSESDNYNRYETVDVYNENVWC